MTSIKMRKGREPNFDAYIRAGDYTDKALMSFLLEEQPKVWVTMAELQARASELCWRDLGSSGGLTPYYVAQTVKSRLERGLMESRSPQEEGAKPRALLYAVCGQDEPWASARRDAERILEQLLLLRDSALSLVEGAETLSGRLDAIVVPVEQLHRLLGGG